VPDCLPEAIDAHQHSTAVTGTARSPTPRCRNWSPGRKSGKEFVNPLVAAPYGDSYIVCASGGGTPQDPQWVANLEAVDGPVTIEVGADTVLADHRVVRPGRDDDWDQLYGVWRAYWPDAATYEKNTDRKFPVAVITLR
jgi:deazaflavin-dependent oxidoreductase (nitroreductase family)